MDIGIFTSSSENDDGAPISFFGYNDEQLLAALYKAASTITGPGLESFDPEPGMRVTKVGSIKVEQVQDGETYVVQGDASAKPETGRMPQGANGTWAIQSLIFSKDQFTLDEARKWLNEHDGFGDYGADETGSSFRFRQYDPQYFSEYRTITIDTGISAAYGKIDKESERSEDEAKKALQASIERWAAVRKVNDAIMARGLQLLKASAVVHKAEDGQEEERFIMSLVLEPNDGEDGAPMKPDTQGDIYSAADVRKAAHAWMEFYGALDLQHSWKALGKEKVRVLECYLAPCDFKLGEGKSTYDVVKGTWLLAVRVVDDELWKEVKSGGIGAYSIGGTAIREEVQ